MNNIHKILISLLLVISGFTVTAQNIFVRPEPARLVNDFAGILNATQVNELENALVAFNDSTSTQIAVVIVKDLMGYDANQLALEIGRKWGVGQKGRNNGVVILIKPKVGNSRGAAAIQAGYGMEAKITDALSKRIIELEAIPQFKENNYYGGIIASVKAVMLASKGEYKAIPKSKNKKGNAMTLVFIVIVFIVIVSAISRKKQTNKTMSSSGSNIPFWLLMGGILGSSGRSGGGWSDFSSGSNEFGGFGGGDFGGGGASGSW